MKHMMVVVTARVAPKIRRVLVAQAKAEGRTVSNVVRRIIEDRVKAKAA